MKLAVLLVATVLTVAGCSSSSTTNSSPSGSVPSASVPAVASSAPVSTPPQARAPSLYWSLPVARRHYLAFVKPSNQALDHLAKLGHFPTLHDLKHGAAKVAHADDLLARQLTVGKWPKVAKHAVAAFIVAIARERGSFVDVADETTLSDAYAATDHEYDASPKGELVRIVLGLPAAK